MGNLVKSRVVAGTPPNKTGWAAPALGQGEVSTAKFVREAGRAVAPAVGPRVAPLSLESSPIPRHSADRGPYVLPTYLRHPEVSA
jgi:hypothetical protein